jgi:transposase
MAAKFKNIDRDTPMLLPCDLRDWVAEDDLVHFVLEAVNTVPLPDPSNQRGTGSDQYPPRMMLALLIYAYACGVFSSRKIERLTRENVAVRYLCANTHPDHDTIARFRAINRELFQSSFVSVVKLARELKLTQLGTVHIDGTKIVANAGKNSTKSLAEVESQLELADRAIAEGMLERSEQADRLDENDSFKLPAELADVAKRKAKLEAARAAIQARVKANPQRAARINLTDADSGFMPQAQGGFVQGYNAQLAVEASGIIIANAVLTETNDRTALRETASAIVAEPGEIEFIVADQGYDNQEQVSEIEQTLDVTVVCPPSPSTSSQPPSPRRTHARAELRKLRTKRARFASSFCGRELLHQRKTTIEPVFGHLKHNVGFRRFQLRGLQKVRAEWALITTAYNCRQIWNRLNDRN